MIPAIKNLAELRAHRARIKGEMDTTYKLILSDVKDIQQSLDPAKIALKFVKNIFTNKHDGFAYDSIRTVVGNISYDSILAFLPWPARVAATYFIKNYVANFVSEKKDNIFSKAAGFASVVKNIFKKKPKTSDPEDSTEYTTEQPYTNGHKL